MIGRTDYSLIGLFPKTYVFEDKPTKCGSVDQLSLSVHLLFKCIINLLQYTIPCDCRDYGHDVLTSKYYPNYRKIFNVVHELSLPKITVLLIIANSEPEHTIIVYSFIQSCPVVCINKCIKIVLFFLVVQTAEARTSTSFHTVWWGPAHNTI